MATDANPKQKLLDTATTLFQKQGFNSTGINQILKESGSAKASLYTHYGSKDELGVAYLQNARKEWFAALYAIIDDGQPGIEKVLSCFDFLKAGLKGNNFIGCKFINMLAEIGDSNEIMRKEIVEHKTKLRGIFKQWIEEDLGTGPQASQLADITYLLFEGAIVESKIYKDTWPVETAMKFLADKIKA
nr:TetR/AcrR family transcriptional regulator [uncultured Mucilaginibacter sp.]